MKLKSNFKLRKPKGPYNIGCCELTLTGQEREVPCLCFYPSNDEGSVYKKYAAESVIEGGTNIETNSYENIAVLDRRNPLLLFTHGHPF